tara:strand:- start:8870 stop:10171 length:1302 start_codon:yes stop_codon:yes gene_type:complete
MRSIQELFDETKHDIDKGHLDRVSRRYRYFDSNCFDDVPKMRHPTEQSKAFTNDMKEVIRCHNHPSLSTKFLRDSDDSVEKIFKRYCKENGYHLIDWKKLKDILRDVDSIVLKLKYKNNRPRPLHYLRDLSDDEQQIKYKKSPSFPSGHTAIAYFLCDVISNSIPEIQQDLQTLASLIGQTRIENAVHFPTDIDYGRLVGETLADLFLQQSGTRIYSGLKTKHYADFAKKLCDKSKQIYVDDSESAAYDKYADDLADFLHRTNEIEFYNVPYNECLDAARHIMMGFPSSYITQNAYIQSQLDGLTMSHKCGVIDNNFKVVRIHECFLSSVLEKGTPGEFRNFSHASRAGVQFPEPCNLHNKLRLCHGYKDKAWLRHLLYEYIHPFCDGNGRSGRIILANDLDYDFSKINQLIGQNYIPTIVKQMVGPKLEKLL